MTWQLIVWTCLAMNCSSELVNSYPTLQACEAAMEAEYKKIESGGVGCIPVEKVTA